MQAEEITTIELADWIGMGHLGVIQALDENSELGAQTGAGVILRKVAGTRVFQIVFPDRTIRKELHEAFALDLQRLRLPYNEVLESPKLTSDPVKRLSSWNFVGRLLYSGYGRSGVTITMRRMQFEMQLLAFAIRQFEADIGKRPQTLEALTPKYIKAVPIDEFSGKPIRYDATPGKARVWSVSYNGKDDGGVQRRGVEPDAVLQIDSPDKP